MTETETSFAPTEARSERPPVGSGSAERSTGRRRSDRIVGASQKTQQVIEQVSATARSNVPVLVVGPTGTGKQHVARALHAWSSRGNGPLVVLVAAGLGDVRAKEELFGALEPSSPLVSGTSVGALERAAGGSLLIHRIDLLSDASRAALVEALQEGSFRRVGAVDGDILTLRARVVATAETGEAELLGGLPTQVVALDSLAERTEDVLPLSAHFLAEVSRENGVAPVGFTSDARRLLVEEPWSANVRELRQRIRLAAQLAAGGAISAEALMLSTEGEEVPSFKEAKRAFETRYVEGLLRRCSGNISRAARLARKDRKDFYDVIRRTGVDPSDFRP